MSDTIIYYFSTTGNCLTTARILAQQLNAKLIPFASLYHQDQIIIEESQIGFVFPIYYGDMPYLVRSVISKMTFKQKEPYIFAFSTYRGHQGDIAKRLDDLLSLKQYQLSLMLGIPMPGNSYLSTEEQIQETLKNQTQNILSQIHFITSKKTEDYHRLPSVENSPMSVLSNMRKIIADDKCIGCGICQQVCPMNNIQICDHKAIINDNCQTCLACFHWCPVEAISMSKEKEIARRKKYHHPDVKLADIINEMKFNR